jgi:hypothetical protein
VSRIQEKERQCKKKLYNSADTLKSVRQFMRDCPHCLGTGLDPNSVDTRKEARKVRESKGLTLLEVSKAMKISVSYLSDLELGRRQWDGKKLKKFQDVMLKAK